MTGGVGAAEAPKDTGLGERDERGGHRAVLGCASLRDALVGGLDDRFGGDHETFFRTYDQWRYELEHHIPACLDDMDVAAVASSRSAWVRAPRLSSSSAAAPFGPGWT